MEGGLDFRRGTFKGAFYILALLGALGCFARPDYNVVLFGMLIAFYDEIPKGRKQRENLSLSVIIALSILQDIVYIFYWGPKWFSHDWLAIESRTMGYHKLVIFIAVIEVIAKFLMLAFFIAPMPPSLASAAYEHDARGLLEDQHGTFSPPMPAARGHPQPPLMAAAAAGGGGAAPYHVMYPSSPPTAAVAGPPIVTGPPIVPGPPPPGPGPTMVDPQQQQMVPGAYGSPRMHASVASVAHQPPPGAAMVDGGGQAGGV
ncbi:unnamed protein product [Vitrella brassicaformis CCMP3155]|uniref:Uncharacterized protein n=2 Tax=Vitrella brassicaformis TaxID=1169539 RepID=A0A0G4F8S9_VITBC|nr:unnamed protein product [Vitrella brassicaformis CCMP3155]|eukprot:CEM08971.1 unnamed protein product [Vitrella brassicaformis CCMP3155]